MADLQLSRKVNASAGIESCLPPCIIITFNGDKNMKQAKKYAEWHKAKRSQTRNKTEIQRHTDRIEHWEKYND